MIDQDDKKWHAALTYLAQQNDAPAEVRKAAKDAVSQYDKALAFYKSTRAACDEQRDKLKDAERQQLPTLLQELRTAKRVNLASSNDQLDAMRKLTKRCERDEFTASRLFVSAAVDLRGACIHRHHKEILTWIAKRRTSDPTAFGVLDSLPEPVQYLYSRLPADWHQPWDEGLTMHDHRRLFLIYQDTFTAPFRASHAWLWQQLAEGEVERLRNGRLRPTRRVNFLPEVPAGKAPAIR